MIFQYHCHIGDPKVAKTCGSLLSFRSSWQFSSSPNCLRRAPSSIFAPLTKSWTRTSRLECAQYGRISKPNLSLQDLTSCLRQHLRLESYPRILLRFKGTFFFFFFLASWVTSSMIWGYDPVNSEASAGVENLIAASGKSWGSGQSMPVAPRIWIPICLEESLCLRVWLI